MVYRTFNMGPKQVAVFNPHQYAHAAEYLRHGAIGVGEDHRVRYARDFAIGLIEKGLVQNLFLECDSYDQPEFNKALHSRKRSLDYYEAIKTIVNDSGPHYLRNPVQLGEVAITAVKHGVNVHFLDLRGKKTTAERAVRRDLHAAKHFNRITAQTGTAGALVLYGGLALHAREQFLVPK